jgi:nucleotide-binding universal stress UspA family protein
MKIIVAAVDFSDATSAVVDTAVSFCRALSAHLELFHVIEPDPVFITYRFTPLEFPEMTTIYDESRRRAENLLREQQTKARTEHADTTSSIADGVPLREILDHIQKIGADLAVVGAHGHSAIASWFLGSVAEGLIRKAVVPTLVVPVRR